MDTDYEIFEIAAVIRDFWLVDSDSYQRKYCTSHGQPLAPGFYVVNWPDHIRSRRFNEHAEFHGPFKSRKEAHAALDCMHKAWERILTMPSDTASVLGASFGSSRLKTAASQESHPIRRKRKAGGIY